MALSNFGGDVGSYMGVGLLRIFEVNRENWSNLPTVVLIKSLARFLPILLIPFLIPDASPADEILTEKEKHLKDEGEEDDDQEQENGGTGVEMGTVSAVSSKGDSGLPAAAAAAALGGSSSSPTRRRPSAQAATATVVSPDLDVLGGAQLEANQRTMQ